MLVVVACSTKKDTFVNRKFHSVNTEYNVLFNGQNALDQGIAELAAGYKDDYWDVLKIERVQDLEAALMPGKTKNANFERAETKATKAVQKHSMNIGNKERNTQMDEAYLLLGKARYHDGRYLPAIEAFNYVMYKYPDSDKFSEVVVWREKANMQLESNDTAIENLKELLVNKADKMDAQTLAHAHAVLAQAYYNEKVVDTALVHLQAAERFTKNNEEKSRYNFIIGQLHDKLGQPDSSYIAYQKVIDMKRKGPRIYMMQAIAKQSGQFDYQNGDTLAFVKRYKKLLDDRENRPYLDVLNHQMALFYDKQNLVDKAVPFYKTSLKKKGTDVYLTASNYRNLAKISFDKGKYRQAGNYYDSTLVLLKQDSKEFYALKRKRQNLDEVIKYEDIVASNDSILHVLSLSPAAKIAYYQKYIDQLKAKDLAAAILLLKQQEAANANASQGSVVSKSMGGGIGSGLEGSRGSLASKIANAPSSVLEFNGQSPAATNDPQKTGNGMPAPTANSVSVFYYYVPVSVSRGKLEFEKRWGKRAYANNWRWSNGIADSAAEEDVEDNDNTTEGVAGVAKEKSLIDENAPQYKTSFYIDQLPKGTEEIENLPKDRNFALYQLGVIYKEKFSELPLAAKRFETLLASQPEERQILPTKYNLYKIYQQINPSKAALVKNDIVAQYPNSHYAAILKDETLAASLDTPVQAFDKVYKQYQDGQTVAALDQINVLTDRYAGDDIEPKLELLKARLLARTAGVTAYKEALQVIETRYPLLDEGKEAGRILKDEVPGLEQLSLKTGESTNWKMVYDISKISAADLKDLKTKLDKYLKDTQATHLKISTDMYQPGVDLLVVHGFRSAETVRAVNSMLRDAKGYKVKQTAFPISADNYKVIQAKKNLTEYLAIKE